MATNLIRIHLDGADRWGVVTASGITLLAGAYATTAALIEQGEADWRAASVRPAGISLDSAVVLSPVTAPCRIYCQGANYRQHMIESGIDPDKKSFNMYFTKSDASLASARDAVRPPAHVKLLDYEIELALIFKRSVSSDVRVTTDTLKDYVFAIAVANDLSARDVQLRQTQFFKGKSYRGFCPIGPWLTVLEPDEFACLDDLQLQLSVNGRVRQRDTTKNLVFKPAETISELTTFANIAPGDVLLTGTPSGCALRVPPPPLRQTPATPARADAVAAVSESAGAPDRVLAFGRSDLRADLERGRKDRPRRAEHRDPRLSGSRSALGGGPAAAAVPGANGLEGASPPRRRRGRFRRQRRLWQARQGRPYPPAVGAERPQERREGGFAVIAGNPLLRESRKRLQHEADHDFQRKLQGRGRAGEILQRPAQILEQAAACPLADRGGEARHPCHHMRPGRIRERLFDERVAAERDAVERVGYSQPGGLHKFVERRH